MTWNVDRYITKPKAIDARVLQVDSTGQITLAQVIVKLETDQVSQKAILLGCVHMNANYLATLFPDTNDQAQIASTTNVAIDSHGILCI
jgi:hypothetical protein